MEGIQDHVSNPFAGSEKVDVRREREKTDKGFSFSTWRAFRITEVIPLA